MKFSGRIKLILTAMLVFTTIISFSNNNSVVSASVSTNQTITPITNNLSKFNLDLQVKLPFTTTVNGLSYTLHKMMIYDVNSKDAKALMKQYGYSSKTTCYPDMKYLIWTKITITNKSKYKMGAYPDDMSEKWSYYLDDGRNFDKMMPMKEAWTYNSKSALWAYILKPGETITTYQAYALGGEFTNLRLTTSFKGVPGKEVQFATLKK
ncbi:hypothetical protein [Paenibacillus glufosinatiresistens]|uniref:hypothetical protein n=1 Tax=Paenibacillus glufosinatiresistens TaxID=3070657 RepID=UPI00286DD73E|nr:hypothetical protein [Paenibacillus sp. YX.27]